MGVSVYILFSGELTMLNRFSLRVELPTENISFIILKTRVFNQKEYLVIFPDLSPYDNFLLRKIETQLCDRHNNKQ